MPTNKFYIFWVILNFVVYFESASSNTYETNKYNECKPQSHNCDCICTESQNYECDNCEMLNKDVTPINCNPGDMIKLFCPLCQCDEKGNHICNKCTSSQYTTQVNRNKREADSFYDYLYKDPLPLSTEQRRELERQIYFQRRQDVIDKRREKQELAQQRAELARQQAEIKKELEYQRRLDEQQRALDAQQDYIDDYVYEENEQEPDEYFNKKNRF